MDYAIPATRWYVKKTARAAMVLGAWASGVLPHRTRTPPGPRIRVLTYHRVGDAVRDPFCVSRRDFEAQMRWLADGKRAMSLGDFEAFLAGRRDLRDGAVLVTVDDGFRSVFTEMLPVLKLYGIPAVAFVNPGLIRDGAAGSPDASFPPCMTWDELAELAAAGVTIGSHGWSHRSLGRMSAAEARDEMAHSREVLQSRLGRPVTSWAYPYGTRADFSPQTTALLAEAGYRTAFTSQHGAIDLAAEPLSLPRIKIEGGEGAWMFRHICHGAMDAWRLVDRTLWCVQAAQ